MKNNKLLILFISFILFTLACSFGQVPASSPTSEPVSTSTSFSPTETFTVVPTTTFTPTATSTETLTPAPTATASQTPIPTVESLKAQVTAKLVCRYGPGAEYLYLFAFNQTANIKLVGRTDANNWVWVENKGKNNTNNNCWVNAKFLNIQGDFKSLPIVYPGLKLPVSSYYPGPKWAKAERKGNDVVVSWEAVPISAGKYEDEFMHQYIVEVWRCEGGQIIFETLGTNFPFITVKNDETGCSEPSHGNVYVQEKHGYGGPVEVPWPQNEGQ